MKKADYHLSLPAARALHLHAQQLLSSPKKETNKQDVLRCIRDMHALQIDTINVVARSPYLVLWSRLGNYQSEWLDELLSEGKLFEYWSHEACFLPIEDFGHYRRQMLNPENLGWKFNHQWLASHADEIQKLHQHIAKHGAVRSIDFERPESEANKAKGWWGWKPEKRSLEVLFTSGKLMVARRHHFQRFYDLTERVHASWNDELHLPEPQESERHKVLNAVKALGIAKASWVADYFRMKKISIDCHPETLAQKGELIKAQIAGWDQTIYVHPNHLAALELAADNKLKTSNVRLLSPFDPVVWDRKRASELFDFKYRLECYTPAEKRQYGYFCLPILRHGKLIGRIDAKAHRQTKIMEIKSLHLEPETRVSAALLQDLANVLNKFAKWHQCERISITTAPTAAIKKQLIALFS
ncbi:winged helix-turn-helix domain-containing protein [Undibacterium sp. Dicai25W]|uniref:winged helix-turn-helix domain-containing protein n=1 Tax=Undibacterium sp. Dicai25W TaxID=3413034 RepID=UPI003BF43981